MLKPTTIFKIKFHYPTGGDYVPLIHDKTSKLEI